MNGRQETLQRREELRENSEDALHRLRAELRIRRDRLQDRIGRTQLIAALARRRALRTSGDALLGARLDVRLERLFEAVRRGDDPWPVDEVVRIVDGVIARLAARRILLGVVGLMTVIPAVASLVLLYKQNEEMIRKNEAEELADYREDWANVSEILHQRYQQVVGTGQEARVEQFFYSHPRLRAEAITTLVKLEKQRWTEEERAVLPPSRLVSFRGSDFSGLSLGGNIGLEVGAERYDFSRLQLDGCDLTGSLFLFARLEGTTFRGAKAEGLVLSSASADHADFREIEAPGSYFGSDDRTGTPFSLEEVRFDGANLAGAIFETTFAVKAGFEGADLTGVVFREAHFAQCDFRGAILGESVDWSGGLFHRCLVTEAQAEVITLPDFCYFESAEEAGTRRIMTDPDRYMAWAEKHQAEVEEETRRQLEARGFSPEEIEAHLESQHEE